MKHMNKLYIVIRHTEYGMFDNSENLRIFKNYEKAKKFCIYLESEKDCKLITKKIIYEIYEIDYDDSEIYYENIL